MAPGSAARAPMTRLLALVQGVVLVAGCAEPTYSYSKAGSNVADFRQDSYACVQEPRMPVEIP